MNWICRDHCFSLQRPLILGIVNVTPDSFSDGGRDTRQAIDHGFQLIADGADMLDIGGESTRPGATPVPDDEELRRVLPVIRALVTKIPISIDTMKVAVAEAAIDAGAGIINDVSGFRDPAMIAVAARHGAGVIVNHMQGTPQDMQVNPDYGDVVAEIDAYFAERMMVLTAAGVRRECICLDPGIGFGKTLPHTLSQLKHLKTHQRHGLPVCLGVSRKGFLGQITGQPRDQRLAATLAVNCFAVAERAAQVLRVHDVRAHADAMKLWEAIAKS